MDKEILENHQRYLKRVGLFKSFGYDIEEERNFILGKAIPIKDPVLEVGTGKGHFTMALAQEGHHFITVDVSAEEQEVAKMNIRYLDLQNNVNFVTGNAGGLKFGDGSFYSCFAVNLVHHLARPLGALNEFIRVTRRGGRIVLADFNEQGFSIIEQIHASEGRRHPKGEVSLDELAKFASSKGFGVEKFNSRCQEIVIVEVA